MANIFDTERLVKRIVTANIAAKKGLAITPLLSGPHGIGKSMILNEVAKDIGGYCIVVEGGSLNEGEITGLPICGKADDGTATVLFTPYPAVSQIQRAERAYYEKARTEGFLGGKVKLDADGNTIVTKNGKDIVYPAKNNIDKIMSGPQNVYKFGEDLDLETKLELLSSGEIKPILLFIDELNRTEQQTMKELMNIILNRSVNGYDFPWYVSVVSAINPCSQNSSYATNEMDDAQRDRFLKIKVNADFPSWVEYALDNNINQDIIEGIAMTEDIFITKDKSHEDTDEMTPSPRSWEMVAHLYAYLPIFNNSKYFTPEERKELDGDMRSLIAGKIGMTQARTLLENIRNKADSIVPADILTGKSAKLDKEIVEKFNRQKKIRQKITVENVIRYLCDHICEYEKKGKSTDEKVSVEYNNFILQTKEFISILDSATRLAFAKKVADLDKCRASDNKPLYMKIGAKCFAKDMILALQEFKTNLNNLNAD